LLVQGLQQSDPMLALPLQHWRHRQRLELLLSRAREQLFTFG